MYMRAMQTQRLSYDGKESLGGLYLNKDLIESFFYDGEIDCCRVVMTSGREFVVAHSVSDMINELCVDDERKKS